MDNGCRPTAAGAPWVLPDTVLISPHLSNDHPLRLHRRLRRCSVRPHGICTSTIRPPAVERNARQSAPAN